jgi:hypothetical protein
MKIHRQNYLSAAGIQPRPIPDSALPYYVTDVTTTVSGEGGDIMWTDISFISSSILIESRTMNIRMVAVSSLSEDPTETIYVDMFFDSPYLSSSYDWKLSGYFSMDTSPQSLNATSYWTSTVVSPFHLKLEFDTMSMEINGGPISFFINFNLVPIKRSSS